MGIASTVTADTEHSARDTARERHADRRDADTVSGNRLEISEKNGVPAWASVSADTSYYYPRFYLGLSEGEKKGIGRNSLL